MAQPPAGVYVPSSLGLNQPPPETGATTYTSRPVSSETTPPITNPQITPSPPSVGIRQADPEATYTPEHGTGVSTPQPERSISDVTGPGLNISVQGTKSTFGKDVASQDVGEIQSAPYIPNSIVPTSVGIPHTRYIILPSSFGLNQDYQSQVNAESRYWRDRVSLGLAQTPYSAAGGAKIQQDAYYYYLQGEKEPQVPILPSFGLRQTREAFIGVGDEDARRYGDASFWDLVVSQYGFGEARETARGRIHDWLWEPSPAQQEYEEGVVFWQGIERQQAGQGFYNLSAPSPHAAVPRIVEYPSLVLPGVYTGYQWRYMSESQKQEAIMAESANVALMAMGGVALGVGGGLARAGSSNLSRVIGGKPYRIGPDVYFREGTVSKKTLYLPEYKITGEMGERPQLMTFTKKGAIWTPETKLTKAQLEYEALNPNLRGGIYYNPKAVPVYRGPSFYHFQAKGTPNFNYATRPPVLTEPTIETPRVGGGLKVSRRPSYEILSSQLYIFREGTQGLLFPELAPTPFYLPKASPFTIIRGDTQAQPLTTISPVTGPETGATPKTIIETGKTPKTTSITKISPDVATFPDTITTPTTAPQTLTLPSTATQTLTQTETIPETGPENLTEKAPGLKARTPFILPGKDEDEEKETKKKKKVFEISEVTPLEGFIPGLDIYLPTTNLPKSKPIGTLTETYAGTKARTKATPRQQAVYGAKRKTVRYASDQRYLGRDIYARNLNTAI